MRFRRLKASIDHNADETPSIYMAICAMESLIDDIEDEAGTDISACPAGSDNMPIELEWLCGVVNQIYRDNRDEIGHTNDMLESEMAELQGYQDELGKIAAVARDLAAAKERLRTAKQELESKREAKKQYDETLAACRAAEQELQTLRAFDAAEEERRLRTLREQVRGLTQEQEELCGQLTREESQLASARLARDHAEQALQEARRENAAIQEELTRLNAQIAGEDTARQLAADKRNGLEKTRDGLAAERIRLTGESQALRAEIDEFEARELAPVREAIGRAKMEHAGLEEAKNELTQRLSAIRSGYNRLVTEIAGLEEQEPAARKKLDDKQAELKQKMGDADAADKRLKVLEQEFSDVTAKLGDLQTEISDLMNRQIPEQKKRVEAEEKIRDEKTNELAGLREQGSALAAASEELQKNIEEAREALAARKADHKAQTDNLTSQNGEIKRLDRALAELNPEDTEHNYEVKLRLLREDIARVRALQEECDRMAASEREQKERLTDLNREKDRLEEEKRKAEDAEKRVCNLIADLKPIVTGEHIARFEAMSARLEQLDRVHGDLVKAMAIMEEALGTAASPEQDAVTRMGGMIQLLRQNIHQMEQDLVACAKSINLEVR